MVCRAVPSVVYRVSSCFSSTCFAHVISSFCSLSLTTQHSLLLFSLLSLSHAVLSLLFRALPAGPLETIIVCGITGLGPELAGKLAESFSRKAEGSKVGVCFSVNPHANQQSRSFLLSSSHCICGFSACFSFKCSYNVLCVCSLRGAHVLSSSSSLVLLSFVVLCLLLCFLPPFVWCKFLLSVSILLLCSALHLRFCLLSSICTDFYLYLPIAPFL